MADTPWLCGGSGKLSDEAKAELEMFAGYLRLGGKRVFGSFAEYQRACEIEATPVERIGVTWWPDCPECGSPLRAVTNDTGYLNADQFDAVKAGDWYCSACKDATKKSGYRYFWNGDLTDRKRRSAPIQRGPSDG